MEERSKEYLIKVKCQKDYPDFTNVVENMDLKELEQNLFKYANYREETELARKKDADLERAKDLVTELDGPYKDTLKALKAKMSYLHVLLQEKKASE